MNGPEVEVLKGVWAPSFIGESQHASATHVVSYATHRESLDHLRQDIRRYARSVGWLAGWCGALGN